MKAVWLKGHEDKDKRRKQVLHYRNAFEDLKEVLLRDYRKKESVRDYELPNWEIRQIAVNEYNRVLDDIINLIELNSEDQKE